MGLPETRTPPRQNVMHYRQKTTVSRHPNSVRRWGDSYARRGKPTHQLLCGSGQLREFRAIEVRRPFHSHDPVEHGQPTPHPCAESPPATPTGDRDPLCPADDLPYPGPICETG